MAGKIYYFDPSRFEIKRVTMLIVETAGGVEYGTVVGGNPRGGGQQGGSAAQAGAAYCQRGGTMSRKRRIR